MLPVAWYFLKVIICSGILYGYYWLLLRNKVFHKYNRFYLMAAVVLSLLLPLIKINFWQSAAAQPTGVIQVLQAVSNGDEYMGNIIVSASSNSFDITQLYPLAYLTVSLVLFLIFLHTIYSIFNLIKKYPTQIIDKISFVNTDAKSTPFSFFNYIFWNNSIDIETSTGHKIFKHELAHVQEKHSHDKIFINIILIFFWCNPFFWLIRKELNMIHEFIADKKAVEDSDTASFAEMILHATYPQHRFQLTNNFFYSPIKRRLLMLTKNKNPKVNYLGRVMVLPLLVLIFAAFTFKVKDKLEAGASRYNGKKITVVIDAGHGGADAGAKSADGILEKDLTLAISKKIKELNSNENIEIILSRNNNTNMNPNERVEFTRNSNADIFISIHADGSPIPESKSGVDFWVAKDEFGNSKESKQLAHILIEEFGKNYPLPITKTLMQRLGGIKVLQSNNIPSVIIETGCINNKKDVAYLKTNNAKETIAKNILAAIEKFAANNFLAVITQNNISDTQLSSNGFYVNAKHADSNYLKSYEYKTKALVIIDSKEIGNFGMNYIEKNIASFSSIVTYNPTVAKKIYGEKGKYGVIKITQKNAVIISADSAFFDEKNNAVKLSGNKTVVSGDLSNTLIYIDGKICTPEQLNAIPPNKISNVTVVKGDKLDDIIDAKGKTAMINVSLKADDLPEVTVQSKKSTPLYVIDGKVKEDNFNINIIAPGNIESINVLKGNSAILLYGEKGKNGVVEIITKKHLLTVAEKNNAPDINTNTALDKIFTKTEIEPSFAGGDDEWRKYLMKNLNPDIPVDEGWKAGTYTIVVQFIVHADGTVSDVTTTNYQNSKTAQHCISLIKQSPNWKPAIQNSKPVNAYRKQPIIFVVEGDKKSVTANL
ncbi:N-acetylmuramoyl-L-alanine amidase [Ferruginibacter sp.]